MSINPFKAQTDYRWRKNKTGILGVQEGEGVARNGQKIQEENKKFEECF